LVSGRASVLSAPQGQQICRQHSLHRGERPRGRGFKDKDTAPKPTLAPTSLISRSLAGDGSTSRRFLDDFLPTTSSPGSCATTMKAEEPSPAKARNERGCRGARQSQGHPRPRRCPKKALVLSRDDLAKAEKSRQAHVRGAPYNTMTQGKIESWIRRFPLFFFF